MRVQRSAVADAIMSIRVDQHAYERALKLGVSTVTVNNWLTGRNRPRPHHLRRISHLSGVPVEELADGSG
jgi:transcriptional regulator with XRE-family HTH domain